MKVYRITAPSAFTGRACPRERKGGNGNERQRVIPLNPHPLGLLSQINELLPGATHSGMSNLCLLPAFRAGCGLNGDMETGHAAIPSRRLNCCLRWRLDQKNNSVSALIKSGQSDYVLLLTKSRNRAACAVRYPRQRTPCGRVFSTGPKFCVPAIPSMPPASGNRMWSKHS